MNNLLLEEGANCIVQNKTLKRGTYVLLQPHETAFIEFSNPKAMWEKLFKIIIFSLENALSNYACLCKGDIISIPYQQRDYLINVCQCEPDDAICVVEADINVDFKPPLDYKPPPIVERMN